MDFFYQLLNDLQDPLENLDSIAGGLMIALIVYAFCYMSFSFALAYIIIVPYLYLTRRRTAKKFVIHGEEQHYYDYRKVSWLHKYLRLGEWNVDERADEFTWGTYFGELLQVSFVLFLVFSIVSQFL